MEGKAWYTRTLDDGTQIEVYDSHDETGVDLDMYADGVFSCSTRVLYDFEHINGDDCQDNKVDVDSQLLWEQPALRWVEIMLDEIGIFA